MTKYPSLYAALEPDEVNGRRGFTVRCTATRRALGFVWWEVASGTTVVWHFRTGQHTGERSTERNAVQALRDVSNQTAGQSVLPFAPEADRPLSPAARTVRPATAVPAPSPAAARRVVWGDDNQTPDLTAAIAAAFTRHDGKKS